MIEDHPLSEIFPLLEDPELAQLAESIARNGQREAIVLYGGRILDGRNRYRACDIAGVKPITRVYDPMKDGPSPLRYVMDCNLTRRHLTVSQKASAAATILKAQEDEARRKAESKARNSGLSDDEERKPGQKKEGEVTQKALAETMGVSPDTVREAQNLQEDDPEEFEKVQKGEKTLNKAKQDASNKKGREQREQVLAAIEKAVGKDFADAVAQNAILKSAKELAAFMALTDEEKQLVRAHVSTGWKVKRALAFAKDVLDAESTIGSLINKAISSGGEFVTVLDGYEVSAYKVES